MEVFNERRRARRASRAAKAATPASAAPADASAALDPPAAATAADDDDGGDPLDSWLRASGAGLAGDPLFNDDELLTPGAAAELWGASVSTHLRLPYASSAAQLPPPAELAAALESALPPGTRLAGAALRRGSLMLALDVYVAEEVDAVCPSVLLRRMADALLPLLRARADPAAARDAFLRCGDEAIRLADGAAVACAPRPPPPSPALAAAVPSQAPLRLALAVSLPAGCTPLARSHDCALPARTGVGNEPWIELDVDARWLGGAGGGGRTALLMLECERAGDATAAVSAPAPLLLTSSAALAAELNAAHPPPSAQQLALLGRALAPRARLALRLRAARLCAMRRWQAGLEELLHPVGGPSLDASHAALSDPGQTGTLALATHLCAMRGGDTVSAALEASGWAALFAGEGWGGKDAAAGAGAAKRFAGELLWHASEGGDAPVLAAAEALAAAREAAKGGGWREHAAVPFLRAAASLAAAAAGAEEEAEAWSGDGDGGEAAAVEDARRDTAALHAEIVAELMSSSASFHSGVCALLIMSHFYYLGSAWLVLSLDSWEALGGYQMCKRLLAETRLWSLLHPDAPPLSPSEGASWAAAQRATRIQAAYSLIVLTPTYIILAVAARRLTAGRLPLNLYEPIFAGGMALEVLGYALTEALILHFTGAAVEWPPIGAGLVFALFTLWLHRPPPFTAPVTRALNAIKLATVALPLLLAGRARVLLTNANYALMIVALCFSAYNARGVGALRRARKKNV